MDLLILFFYYISVISELTRGFILLISVSSRCDIAWIALIPFRQFMDSPAGVTAELEAEGWQETWSWFGLIQHFQSFSGENNIRS